MDNRSQYQEELNYLYSLQKHGIKFGLSKTSNLLEGMDNPHKGQNFIHIGGTNGKGSVASFISAILQECGYCVGLYTSPHLASFTERIMINSRPISRESLISLVRELRSIVVPEEPPTFFEAVTALALSYFAREKPDIVILEVGMGGRLDATNVVSPLLSIITNISLEHQDFLGNSLQEIAEEKAGIIKPNIPLISGVQQESIQELFREKCRDNNSAFHLLGSDFEYRQQPEGLEYLGMNMRLDSIHPGLSGEHQSRNAALAIAALEELSNQGYTIDAQNIRSGLESAAWPGRMQIVKHDPCIILDGAHNPEALLALKNTLQKDFSYQRLYLVLGIMQDKDIDSLLQIILPFSDYVFYTAPDYFRALSPDELEARALPWDKKGTTASTIPDALDMAQQKADPRDMILVTGSLFTVGEALTYFYPVEFAPD